MTLAVLPIARPFTIVDNAESYTGRSATADQPNRSYRSAKYGPFPFRHWADLRCRYIL